MGERDQVIASQEEIKRLRAENAKLREEFKPLIREVENVQVAEASRDRAVDENDELRQQLNEQQTDNTRIRALWAEDCGRLRNQLAQLESEKCETETSMQTMRSTLETTQHELTAAREEIQQLRAEMLEQREQAARDAAKRAESERERRVEAAREARQRDAALEEHILQLARQVNEERLQDEGAQPRQEFKEDKDEGASSYTQPSSPQSSTANTIGVQERQECPHCRARMSGATHDDKQSLSNLTSLEHPAAHIAAVAAAQQEWDSNQQEHQRRNRGSPSGYHLPQRSTASAAALESGVGMN